MNLLQLRRGPARTLVWVSLVLFVGLYAFPFVHLVLTSFKSPMETIAVPPRVIPTTWTLANYETAITRDGVLASFVNSLSTAVIATIVALVLAVPAAYAITRFRTNVGRHFIVLALVTRMVPPVTLGVPMLSIMGTLGLTDRPLGLALAHVTLALPLCVLLLASFFEVIPHELDEAARIDGCSRLGALGRVVLPVVKGGVAVTALFAFLASWNDFLFALLLTSNRAQTTPIAIANFQTHYGLDWGAMTALSVLYSVPVVLLAIALQRHIVAGLTLGAVKG